MCNVVQPIPNEFLEAHKDDCQDAADLEDPSGNLWLVDIKSGMGGVAFREGWKPFVFSLNLKRGDQLLFSLIAKNRFYVYVLNRNGAEVPPASSKAHFKSSLPLNKRKREPEEQKGSDDSDTDSGAGSDSDDDEGSISGESESSEYDASKSEDEASDHEEDSKGNSKVKKEKLDYGPKTPIGRGKVSSKVKLTTGNKKAGDMAQKEKEGLLEPGWNSTTYESRRRPVTDAERQRAMKAAQNFKTTRPSQLVLMKPSHVYRGFWLVSYSHFDLMTIQYLSIIIDSDAARQAARRYDRSMSMDYINILYYGHQSACMRDYIAFLKDVLFSILVSRIIIQESRS